jgi:hypothetical protein
MSEERSDPREGVSFAPGEIRATIAPFQRAMADQFKSIVEEATGHQVRSFFSDTDLDNDLAVEVFVLGDPLTDMARFEPAVEETDGGPSDAG